MKAGTLSTVAMCVGDGSGTGLVTRGLPLPRIEKVYRLRARSMQYAGVDVSEYALSRQTKRPTPAGVQPPCLREELARRTSTVRAVVSKGPPWSASAEPSRRSTLRPLPVSRYSFTD